MLTATRPIPSPPTTSIDPESPRIAFDAAAIMSDSPLEYDAENTYRYVGNNPTNFVDPDGLAQTKLPVHGSTGYWRSGPSSTSTAGKQYRGNGWFHPFQKDHPGAKPVQYIDDVPHFSRHFVKYKGENLTVEIPAQGTSVKDTTYADELIRQNVDEAFPGARALGASWHHKSTKDGKFVMELVHRPTHNAAKHTGAFAKYLDWVADAVKGGTVGELTAAQQAAVATTLEDAAAKAKVANRIGWGGNRKIARALTQLTPELAQSGGRVGLRRVGGTILRKGAGPLAVIFIVYSGADTYANTGDLRLAAEASAREFVMADVGETAFKLTIVRGSDVVAESVLHPDRVARGRGLRDPAIDAIGEKYDPDNLRSFAEIGDEQVERAGENAKGTFWSFFNIFWADPFEDFENRKNAQRNRR